MSASLPHATPSAPAKSERGLPLAVAAMVGSAACWGFATVMSKGALGHLPPFSLLGLQLGVSVAVLWAAVALTRESVPLDAGGRRAAMSGVLEPGLSYAAGTAGLALTGAAHASLIGATEPLHIVLLAWALFRARPPRATMMAIAVAVPGVALVTANDPAGAGNSLMGDALIVLGTMFAAGYVVATSRLASRVAPLPLAALQQSVGLAFAALLLVAVLALGFEAPDLAAVPPSVWLLAAASGVVQYALAFWLYLFGLRTLPVGTAALFLALIPVFGAGGATLFLGERLNLLQLVGCALVIGAVAAAALRASALSPVLRTGPDA